MKKKKLVEWDHGRASRRLGSEIHTSPRVSKQHTLHSITSADEKSLIHIIMSQYVLQSLFMCCWGVLSPLKFLVTNILWWHAWTVHAAREVQRRAMNLIGYMGGTCLTVRLPSLWGNGGSMMAVLIRRWHLLVAALVAKGLYTIGYKAYRDMYDETVRKKKQERWKIEKGCCSYYEWCLHVSKLEALEGVTDRERKRLEQSLYDRDLLEGTIDHLRRVRYASEEHRACSCAEERYESVKEQMYAVRCDLVRNLGNIADTRLNQHFPIVPGLIREYIDEVRLHLEQITLSDDISIREKLTFLRETRHSFGRTALVLSGGGVMGVFHLGVLKALVDHHMVPRILAGSSAGSLVGAFIATRSDAELQILFQNTESMDLAFFAMCAVDGKGVCTTRLRRMLGDLTFLEAYTHTGRILNIFLETPGTAPRVLNYLTSPDILVWSAVVSSLSRSDGMMYASSAGESRDDAVSASPIGKTFYPRCAKYKMDSPIARLSEMFSVNHFIVSQITPSVAPFLSIKQYLGAKVGRMLESEFQHTCRQIKELLPTWIPRSWLQHLSEPWEGDVTIVPSDPLLHMKSVVSTPTPEDIIAIFKMGEVSTWRKMSAVQCNCGIELTLDECLHKTVVLDRQDGVGHSIPASVTPLKNSNPVKCDDETSHWHSPDCIDPSASGNLLEKIQNQHESTESTLRNSLDCIAP
mmetsp:Transcript_7727/g.15526  ORF Transcript_7727/g.15526 Transcript_7727/m.15526 type:complete len:692 (+) Transcript_7727:28-2103(+)